jgi:hypothetical protein
MTFGLDPITATVVTTLGGDLIKSLLGGGSSPGLTPAQIAAIQQQQRAAADGASRQAWMIGLGLAAVGVVAVVLISRRK